MMTTVTTYVRNDDTATLICPACKTVKHIAVGKFRQGKHTITVRCICKHTFSVLFDFRQYYRKQVNLPGTYEIISEGGIVSGLHRIEEGQKLQVEFQLNDKKKTLLKRELLVRTVRQNTIGCRLTNHLEEKELGFFLQP